MKIKIKFLVISQLVTMGKKLITAELLDIEQREGIKQIYFNRNEFQLFTLTVRKTAFKCIPYLLTCTPMGYAAQNYADCSANQYLFTSKRQISFTESRNDLLQNNTNIVATNPLRREGYYENTEIKRECMYCLKQVTNWARLANG